MKALDNYPYSGHSRLMGKIQRGFQDTEKVLALFGPTRRAARRRYRDFVTKGLAAGKRPVLTGGGLIRSAGCWQAQRGLRREGVHYKSDERLLGDSDFVDSVLKAADETRDRKYRLHAAGYDLEAVVARVCGIYHLNRRDLLSRGKQRRRAMARSVVAY